MDPRLEKEHTQPAQAERVDGTAVARGRRRVVLYVVVGTVVAVAAVLALAASMVGGGDSGEDRLPTGEVPAQRLVGLRRAAALARCEVRSFPSEGRDHFEAPMRVPYRTNPPTSGDHRPTPAVDGIHSAAPPQEKLVHALEHGRMIVYHRPDASLELRSDLKALVEEDPLHMLMAPNQTGMPYEVAATVWRKLVGCPRMNDRVYDAFRALRFEYRDRGPEYVR